MKPQVSARCFYKVSHLTQLQILFHYLKSCNQNQSKSSKQNNKHRNVLPVMFLHCGDYQANCIALSLFSCRFQVAIPFVYLCIHLTFLQTYNWLGRKGLFFGLSLNWSLYTSAYVNHTSEFTSSAHVSCVPLNARQSSGTSAQLTLLSRLIRQLCNTRWSLHTASWPYCMSDVTCLN